MSSRGAALIHAHMHIPAACPSMNGFVHTFQHISTHTYLFQLFFAVILKLKCGQIQLYASSQLLGQV